MVVDRNFLRNSCSRKGDHFLLSKSLVFSVSGLICDFPFEIARVKYAFRKL